MSTLTLLAFLFLLIVLVATPIIYGFKIVQLSTEPLRRLIFYTWYPNRNPPDFSKYASLLQNRFSYFKLLNRSEQGLFVSRLQYIQHHKEFIGRGMEVTDEMEILVSAAIAQITFGLAQFDLEELLKIELTPESFYSNLVQRQVKGLTGDTPAGGRIIMSWKDFEEGYLIPDDKINLGLHELGHALWLYHPPTRAIDQHFDEWNVAALMELQKMRDGNGNSFLRNYASTNIEEFWAVTAECFFEAPVEFRKCIPKLYAATGSILNQDMANRYESHTATLLVNGYNAIEEPTTAKNVLQ